MPESDRPRRPVEGAVRLAPRLRSLLGLADRPPPPRRRPLRLDPVKRSWLAAWWQARVSVHAGVPLEDFMRSRLAHYLAGLHIARSRLPLDISEENGVVSARPAAEPRAAEPSPGDGDAWLAPLVAVEGPAARQEIWEAEAHLARLDSEIEAARRRAEEISRRLAADVAAGLVPTPSAVNATPEQFGRPPVRGAALPVAAGAFGLAALVAETWQVAIPLLRAMGLDPGGLRTELLQRPAEVALAGVFALGVAGSLFVFAHVALYRSLDLFRGDPDVRRRRWLGAAAGGAALAAAIIAGSMAALRPDPPEAPPEMARWTFALLLLAVPTATAFLVGAGRTDAARRGAELAAALEWDRERARLLAERARRLEELEWAEAEERAFEAERATAHRRLRALDARAMEAARAQVEADRREAIALARLAQSFVGALELDRYEFVRQAAARGAAELLAPRRRRVEPRAILVEPAPDIPTPVAVSR